MITKVISIVLGILLLQWLFPFWGWIMIVPFLFGLTTMHAHRQAFGLSFVAGFLAWTLPIVYLYFTKSHLIAGRIAETLTIGNSFVLITISIILAAVIASVASLAGFTLRTLFIKPKKAGKRWYY